MNTRTNAHPDSEDVLRMLAVGHLDPDSPAWVAAAAGVPALDPVVSAAPALAAALGIDLDTLLESDRGPSQIST